MVPEVPLNSPAWQIYASVMKRMLTGLSSERSVESVQLVLSVTTPTLTFSF